MKLVFMLIFVTAGKTFCHCLNRLGFLEKAVR